MTWRIVLFSAVIKCPQNHTNLVFLFYGLVLFGVPLLMTKAYPTDRYWLCTRTPTCTDQQFLQNSCRSASSAAINNFISERFGDYLPMLITFLKRILSQYSNPPLISVGNSLITTCNTHPSLNTLWKTVKNVMVRLGNHREKKSLCDKSDLPYSICLYV
jgi:hypothetical protein